MSCACIQEHANVGMYCECTETFHRKKDLVSVDICTHTHTHIIHIPNSACDKMFKIEKKDYIIQAYEQSFSESEVCPK